MFSKSNTEGYRKLFTGVVSTMAKALALQTRHQIDELKSGGYQRVNMENSTSEKIQTLKADAALNNEVAEEQYSTLHPTNEGRKGYQKL